MTIENTNTTAAAESSAPLHQVIADHAAAYAAFAAAADADPTPEDEAGNVLWHDACQAEAAAFLAVADYQPCDLAQVRVKSAYVLYRLQQGDLIDYAVILRLLRSFCASAPAAAPVALVGAH